MRQKEDIGREKSWIRQNIYEHVAYINVHSNLHLLLILSVRGIRSDLWMQTYITNQPKQICIWGRASCTGLMSDEWLTLEFRVQGRRRQIQYTHWPGSQTRAPEASSTQMDSIHYGILNISNIRCSLTKQWSSPKSLFQATQEEQRFPGL